MALKECRRVLKDSGYVYFFEPNFHHIYRILTHSRISPLRYYNSMRVKVSPAEKALRMRKIIKYLKNNGFIIELQRYVSPKYSIKSVLNRIQNHLEKFATKVFPEKYVYPSYILKAKKE